ncbi:MAG TPA: L,D-transpeptidase family protein [Thermoleophilaceae bacterium]|nr:L,D-transpeptidase family protein [Thermoleophilaceae bacterium]
MKLFISSAAVLLAFAGSTGQAAAVEAEPAATPTVTTPAPPPPPDAKPTKPKAGKATLEIEGGIATRKLRYVARGDRLAIDAAVRPYVAGQIAVLVVRRSGKVVDKQRARVRPAKRGAGKVSFNFKPRRKGVYKAQIHHAVTDGQLAFRSRAARFKAVVLSAGEGKRGTDTLLLQRGLDALGYAVPVTGYYDDGTSRAVIAFRKVNGMERIGYASPEVFKLVLQGRGAFKPKYPDAGYHVEYDWSRQVLGFFRNGKAVNVYHSSSGAPVTPTVFGTFTFYRKEPGTNHLGMVQSNYFIRGYAIHGYKSVPVYPASHGCLRVPVPNAYQIDRQITLGMKIMVYV